MSATEQKGSSGFTLIELLIVVAIIAILAAIAV
ncbi:prepilin-type N-terminal cleavage/methylation domain-containing protein, partial [Candidatus Sumerlaeota bacterium]|nr:prepilin-type N-terminal cleavage/methylation domain-containing protein [Candidatus Sumerlaeota bacterium]